MKKIISTVLITIIFLSTYNTQTMLAKRTMHTGCTMLTGIARTANTFRNTLAQTSPRYTTIRTIDAKPVINNKKIESEKIKSENEIKELISTLPNPHLTLEILLKFINDIDKDAYRALRHPSQSEEYINVARFLLACHIHDIDEDGHTVLTWAAQNGKVELTKLLLATTKNVNTPDKDGMTALMWAAKEGRVEIAQLLLTKEANINATDKSGFTALKWASDTFGLDAEITQILCNANKATLNKMDPVDKKTKKVTVAKPAIKHKKTNTHASSEHDIKDLMHAAQSGHTVIIEALMATGININATDNNGMTALMWAAKKGRLQVIQLLLAMNADRHATDNNGFTAWTHASDTNQTTEIQEILWYGLDRVYPYNSY